MSRKNVNFRDKKIKKSDFYKNKKVTKINDIDANKILVFKEEPYSAKNLFQYFIGFNDNDVIRLLCTNLPQMTAMLENLKVIQQCPLRLVINNLIRSTIKYGKELKNY